MSESGICRIKPEFIIIEEKPKDLAIQCVSDKDLTEIKSSGNEIQQATNKRQQENGEVSNKKRKKLQGQNKSRGPTYRITQDKELCNLLVQFKGENVECNRKNCNFLHNIEEYLKVKGDDLGDTCYNFETTGKCERGLACRFGSQHINGNVNIINEEKYNEYSKNHTQTRNILNKDLQHSLRKKTYDFSLSEALIKYNDKAKGKVDTSTKVTKSSGTVTDEDIIKIQQREKQTIDWKGKIFLSPLTTVGNLPFRRICKEFGVDITCGEMAMCSSLLQGAPQEWALVKRHHTEDIFGVQLCANNPHVLTKCGQLLTKEIDIDFIDLNLGCPIDLVYKEGGGCALLRRQKVLESCVTNLSQIINIPLTVKTRTGVYSDERIAHKLAPNFRDWGASLLTIHGRSREQRYTKMADWNYINEVVQAAAPLPVYGNGDILSYNDYKSSLEICPGLAGVMIGRGALIKPWIFTEIKEQRIWDISSSERFDILKKFTNYGLEHWGSDNKGVENTRRFMLEWLSFLYRYVPVGLLEQPPQKVNERPPSYRGRNDLETLMASNSASDWIKITEMLLGPVPENFRFLPKHKANSYK
ncbi:tRNA-dihydrouridine(47) synthase [NAD(P)(+)]-like [Coccinella septempunctata]|uniref:tRNA-dihydrouridine(47) synthase [NAD(P)(+)]-like n=1 Tax=Coccinella septempunctata TaxID=41139 RepID=UPI001D098413|nr:tRNA-dihydrouridine(47) synthase [NAD(P)(+)]-like [Coccinella septempunctata]